MGLLRKTELKNAPEGRTVPSTTRIETDIDRLYQLVLERGPIKIGQAAALMGRDKPLIEDWARVLEAANLIKIHVPTVGEPELVHS